MDDLKTVREAAKRLAEIERLVDAGRRRTKRVAVETKVLHRQERGCAEGSAPA